MCMLFVRNWLWCVQEVTTACDEIFNILLVYKPTVLLADCTQNIHIFNVFGRLIMDSLKLLFGSMELKLTRFYYIHRGLKLFHK